jgi:hypothetical protein
MAEAKTADRRLIEDMVSQGVLRRILVVQDLGPVNEGDHIIVVANVAVAVDTSRHPDAVVVKLKPVLSGDAAEPKRTSKKKAVELPLSPSRANILHVIREHQPIASMQISDKLGLERGDSKNRHRVTDMIKSLVRNKEIERRSDERVGHFRYQIKTADIDASQ